MMKKETLRQSNNKTIEKLRRLAIEQFRKGFTIREVSDTLSVGQSTLKEWKRLYKLQGSKFYSLKKRGVKKGSGEITSAQMREIKKLITDKTPDQCKLAIGLWTRGAVQELIKRKFGIEKSLPQIGRYLKTWGFTSQKPIYKAYEQQPEEVKQWLEKDFPKLKKKAKKEKSVIYFGDETGLRSDHQAGKTFSPKGKTPVVKKSGKRFSLNMVSAISARGDKRFMIFKGRFNTDCFINFLRQLTKNQKQKILFIIDNYSVHKTKKVKEWVKKNRTKIELFYLPRYSPELNPDEYLNNDIKTNLVGKTNASNTAELAKAVKTHLKKKSNAKIKKFFQHKAVQYAA